MDEELHGVFRIPPRLFHINLRQLRKDLHKRDETIGDLHQPGQHDKEPQEQQKRFNNKQDNDHNLSLIEILLEPIIQLNLGPVGKIIKRRQQVILESPELSVA